MSEKAFLLLDLKNISRDIMLLALLPVPLILAFALRLGFSTLAGFLNQWIDFEKYAPLILMFILNLGPLLTGMISGLLLVDEADDHVLPALAVTPPGRRGFLIHRLLSPCIWSFLVLLPVPLLSGLAVNIPFYKLIPILVLSSFAAPVEALIIAVLAKNKIEAMAIGKMTGILFIAPFITWFVPGAWKFLGGIIPGFWVSLYAFTVDRGNAALLLPPLLLNGIGIFYLLKRFDRRIS